MSHVLKDVIKNLSLDCVIFSFENGKLQVLLVMRAIRPNKGAWALPGGFIKRLERVDDAANRILAATTGIGAVYLEEFGVFDALDRYPLRRVITIGYYALIAPDRQRLVPGIDTSEVKWCMIDKLPPLAFDHKDIIMAALAKLRTSVREKPVGFEMLPQKFTIPQLQTLYESILGEPLDKRNFRKKLFSMNLITKLKEKDRNNTRRAAHLYRFDKTIYKRLIKDGFNFDL